jgi:hypothetical protein
MSAAQLTHSAEFCNIALGNTKDNELDKLVLELKLFQFMHGAAKKYIGLPPKPSDAIIPEISGEKLEIISSLDEDEIETLSNLDAEEKKSDLGDEAHRAILVFNCRIVAALDMKTEEATDKEIDETNYNKLQESHLKSIKELHKKNWQTHLNAFSTYIQYRATVRPFLFINSREDYLLRKAYFDAITVKDDNINDIYKKIEIIVSAINNPRINKGFSHRCMDILKLLKKDFETWVFLLETKNNTPEELQNEMSNIAEEKRHVI